MVAATQEYLDAEDNFGRWREECCRVGKDYWGAGDPLWQSWFAWAERGNEPVGTRKAFAQTMKARGHEAEISGRVRGYSGIALVPRTNEGGGVRTQGG